jgi:hypothetical protein
MPRWIIVLKRLSVPKYIKFICCYSPTFPLDDSEIKKCYNIFKNVINIFKNVIDIFKKVRSTFNIKMAQYVFNSCTNICLEKKWRQHFSESK